MPNEWNGLKPRMPRESTDEVTGKDSKTPNIQRPTLSRTEKPEVANRNSAFCILIPPLPVSPPLRFCRSAFCVLPSFRLRASPFLPFSVSAVPPAPASSLPVHVRREAALVRGWELGDVGDDVAIVEGVEDGFTALARVRHLCSAGAARSSGEVPGYPYP